jgi:hypothetical protein
MRIRQAKKIARIYYKGGIVRHRKSTFKKADRLVHVTCYFSLPRISSGYGLVSGSGGFIGEACKLFVRRKSR